MLEAIIEYAEDENLCQAAEDMLSLVDTAFSYRLGLLADNADNLSGFALPAEFGFLVDLVKEDPSAVGLTDKQLKIFNILEKSVGAITLSIDIGVLAADIIINISDILYRLNEMQMLYQVQKALNRQVQEYYITIETEGDVQCITELCDLMQIWLYVNYRGEYCQHEMLVDNGGFWSMLYVLNGENVSADEYLSNVEEITLNFLFLLENNIFPNAGDFARGSEKSEGLVAEVYRKEMNYTLNIYNEQSGESEPTEFTAVYSIPEIQLSGDEVAIINENLYDSLYPVIESAIQEAEDFGWPQFCDGASYCWAVWNDILSLAVTRNGNPEISGGNEYMVYNISVSNQTGLTNTELYEALGLKESEAYTKIRNALETAYKELYASSYENNTDNNSFMEIYEEALERTLTDENIGQVKPYLDDNGQLRVIAKIYSLAAAEYYWQDIAVDVAVVEDDVPSKTEVLGELTYPISEEAAKVIIENRLGHDMEDGYDYIDIYRYGTDENEHILFEFYDEGSVLYPMPGFYFEVYVHTGEVIEGVPTGHSFTYNAEEYYY